MDDDGKQKPVEESLYVRDESSARLEEEPSSGEVESDDDGADDMDEERENRAKYPGGENSGTPEPFINGDVFEVENIFDESETECDEDREEDSLLDRVDRGEGAPENREMFACLFDDPDDEVIKEHEFERPEDDSTYRDSPICEGIIPESERENDRVKQGKKQGKKEENKDIFDIYSCCFPDICEEKSKRKNPDNPRDTEESEDGREAELRQIIPMAKEGEDVPRCEREAREYFSHEENRHDREGSRENPDRETTGIQRRVVHIRKYIPPKEYGQEGNECDNNERENVHGVLFLSKYFVFTKAETLSFAILKGSREEEYIHPDEDEKYPDKPSDELWYSDYDDAEEDKNNTDEIHKMVDYNVIVEIYLFTGVHEDCLNPSPE